MLDLSQFSAFAFVFANRTMGCDKLASRCIAPHLDIAMILFVQTPRPHTVSIHTVMEVLEINTGNRGKLALVTQDDGGMLFGDEIQPHASQVTIKNSASQK
jgi:hypothetical protein